MLCRAGRVAACSDLPWTGARTSSTSGPPRRIRHFSSTCRQHFPGPPPPILPGRCTGYRLLRCTAPGVLICPGTTSGIRCHDRLYRRDGFLLYIYFPVMFIFLLLLNFDLFHTAPCPVYLLCPLQTVSPDTEIVGLFLFEVLYYHFVFGDQLNFFVLPLFGGTLTDLIAFCSGGSPAA